MDDVEAALGLSYVHHLVQISMVIGHERRRRCRRIRLRRGGKRQLLYGEFGALEAEI